MYILGINSAYHELAACLVRNGRIIAAAEEERFNRVKHGKSARVDNADQLPVRAIEFCLAEAGIPLSEVAWIGYSINPERRLQNQNFTDPTVENDWGGQIGEQTFYRTLLSIPDRLREMGFHGQFKWIDHHLAHAASAYYVSGFSDAAVLAIDGIGETSSTLMAVGRGRTLETISEVAYPASIGFLWEKLCKMIGFSEYDACKVMGLSAYGDPNRYQKEFQELVQTLPNGMFAVDSDIVRFRVEDYSRLESLFGLKKRGCDEQVTKEHRDLAAALQKVTEDVIMHMVHHLHTVTGSENLCMAGGVALNCVANGLVEESGPFKQVFVQPAANDAGTALGAAFYIHHMELGQDQRGTMAHAYLGPSFTNEQIEAVLKEAGVTYERVDAIETKVAELLRKNQIVGWFQGRMEFGPRALGNRSLLADPRDPANPKRLNDVVKHREDFRPFAPSVLCEEAPKWFEMSKPALSSDFMLVGYKVRPEQRNQIPAVIHVDGTSRIQTVRRETNPRYHKVISEFKRMTGVPVVLNTSFNDTEPIVCTPADAVRTFHKTAIDYLAIGDFLCRNER